MPDLWPEDIGTTNKRAPVDMLREQAILLGEKTGGLITARVKFVEPMFAIGAKTHGSFRFDFDLLAPRLNNYSYTLFSISNFASLYPAYVEFDEFDGGKATARCEEEFEGLVRQIFTSQKTRDLISGIRAQIGY